MLKNLQENKLALQNDLELLALLKNKLESRGITSFNGLIKQLENSELTDFNELNDKIRLNDFDFETTLLWEEILNRLRNVRNSTLEKFYSSSQVGYHLIDFFQGHQQEQLIAIYLDAKNKVLAQKVIFQGSLNKSVAHPREVFKQAILLNSAALIIAHNHPSGETTPSKQDMDFSERMVAAGELIGIECLDHFVIGGNYYLSMKEEDLI